VRREEKGRANSRSFRRVRFAFSQEGRDVLLISLSASTARDVYAWSRYTPLESVKVVIIGQDPYHDDGERCSVLYRSFPLILTSSTYRRSSSRFDFSLFRTFPSPALIPLPSSPGLCFSVRPGVKIPPSLRNIYKELKEEYPSFVVPTHGFVPSRLVLFIPFPPN
jgi:uracil-DNA glycosylase